LTTLQYRPIGGLSDDVARVSLFFFIYSNCFILRSLWLEDGLSHRQKPISFQERKWPQSCFWKVHFRADEQLQVCYKVDLVYSVD